MMRGTAVLPSNSIELGGRRCDYERRRRLAAGCKALAKNLCVACLIVALTWSAAAYLESSAALAKISAVAAAARALGDSDIQYGQRVVSHARALGLPCRER